MVSEVLPDCLTMFCSSTVNIIAGSFDETAKRLSRIVSYFLFGVGFSIAGNIYVFFYRLCVYVLIGFRRPMLVRR